MFKNKLIKEILNKYRDIWALEYSTVILNWDLETYMPQKGVTARGEATASLSSLSQKLFLKKDFVALIKKAEKEKDLNDYEKGVVRELSRMLNYYEKVPASFLEEFQKLINSSSVIWREAKKGNNWQLFRPYLEKIFEMSIKKAEYLGYKDNPYDALLDEFEEGLTAENVLKFTDSVKTPLKNLLAKIKSSPKYSLRHPLEDMVYDRNKLEALNRKILGVFWDDPERLRLDVSTHPFTMTFSPNDIRITTRYHSGGFAKSFLSVVHEFGHALYDLQADPALEFSPISRGVSLVIHESQSRFWENFVGRSREMSEYIYKDVLNLSPEIKKYLSKEGPEGIYSYLNNVAPGTIRVDADEITYHFHVILRFEIEKGIIEGKYKVKDLPEIWEEKMKEYLGITPKNNSEGVLQDIHWSGGLIGYFPTYSLGTFLSAIWKDKMKLEKVEINNKSLGYVKTWLKEHVHRFGAAYTLDGLLKKDGYIFDPNINIKYLSDKYSKIYGF